MRILNIRKGMVGISFAVLMMIVGSPIAGAEETGTTQCDGKFSLGYRAFSNYYDVGRAVEYTRAESGATGELQLKTLKGHRQFYLQAEYLNNSEYSAEAGLDYLGLLRLDLFGEGLYHNLDHLPYANRPDAGTSVVFSDLDPRDDYHLDVSQSGGKLRTKVPGYPAHVNLAYWRLKREGSKQLRFTDEGNGIGGTSCLNCHVKSRTQEIDQVTEEVTGSIDAHFGPINVAFEQVFREFEARESIPVDTFGSHRYRTGPADLEHDEAPDSRFTESTLKLNTSPAGGLVAAVALGMGEMESLSDVRGVRPVDAETDFRKAAGDVTYTPNESWTLNFRYRFLDFDTSNPAQISVDALAYSPIEVRDSIDQTRAQYEAIVSYRPLRRLTLKGEFRRTEIERSHTGEPMEFTPPPTLAIDPVWELPEEEVIQTYRLSLFSRPLGSGRLKMNGWYEYKTSDDPAYAISVEKGHTAFAGITWNPSGRWGVLVNGRYRHGENGEIVHALPNQADAFTEFRLNRESEEVQGTSGLWLMPFESVTLGLNYGYLYTRVTQDLLFGSNTNTVDPSLDYALTADDTDYYQKVHTASATVTWRILESLLARVEGRHIRSEAYYGPEFFRSGLVFGSVTDVVANSSGLRDLGSVDIRQTGIQVGLEWSPMQQWSVAAGFSYDDYDDQDANIFDGSARMYTASVAHTW